MWNEHSRKQLLVDGDKEIAPEGATGLLRMIQGQIVALDAECRVTEYTDTDVVWQMFDDWRQRITAMIGEGSHAGQSSGE